MKKLLLGIVLGIVFCIPFSVFALPKEKVNVYLFEGDGCPHCAEAKTFFESIDDGTFQLVEKEVWYSESNNDLMKKIAIMRGEEDTATGVPYIIIGNKSWVGYSSYLDNEIKNQIKIEYEKDSKDRYDVMKEYEKVKDTIVLDDEQQYVDDDYLFEDDYVVEETSILTKALPFFIIGMIIGAIILVTVVVVVTILVINNQSKKKQSR